MIEVNDLLQYAVEQRGSDLHIKVGSPPHVRIDGKLTAAPFDVVSPADAEGMAYGILPKDRADEFDATSEADFAHSVPGAGRFRANVFRQRGSIGLVLRRVLPGPPSCESLGLPPVVGRLAEEAWGPGPGTGPAGAGKTD